MENKTLSEYFWEGLFYLCDCPIKFGRIYKCCEHLQSKNKLCHFWSNSSTANPKTWSNSSTDGVHPQWFGVWQDIGCDWKSHSGDSSTIWHLRGINFVFVYYFCSFSLKRISLSKTNTNISERLWIYNLFQIEKENLKQYRLL